MQLKRKLSSSFEKSNEILTKIYFRYSLLYDSHITSGTNLSSHEWSDYISPAKRPHHSLMLSSALPHLINHPSLFEYQANGIHSHQEQQMVSSCLSMFGFLSFYVLFYFKSISIQCFIVGEAHTTYYFFDSVWYQGCIQGVLWVSNLLGNFFQFSMVF